MPADGVALVPLTNTGQNSFPSWGRAQTPDGTLLAWGNNPPPYGLTDVVAIDVASSMELRSESDGTIVAWNRDPCSYVLEPPDGLADVIAVSAAGTYSMALKSDGTVVAWAAGCAGSSTRVPAATSRCPPALPT